MINLSDYCILLITNQIVHVEYCKDVVIDLKTAKAIVRERERIANHLPHKVLVKGGPITITADARKFALGHEASALITYWAVVSEKNLLKQTFFKLLFFIHNGKHKMQFCKDEASALAWLNSRKGLVVPSLAKKEEALI